jgi:hypothetical protein
MPWYFYLLEFLSGAFLMNSVPHLVHGISGAPFPSPFAKPPGEGDSSPLVNVLWGFANLVGGALLLYYFLPEGQYAFAGWILVALGGLAISVQLALHFGKVQAKKR